MHDTVGSPEQTEPGRCDDFAKLSRALVDADHQLPRIFDALTTSLTASLCDRCSIEVTSTGGDPASATFIATARHAVLPLTGATRLHGSVTVVREGGSPAFEASELADIQCCIAYATLAAELAIRLEGERAAYRAEQDRTERFHHTMLSVVGHDMRGPVSAILLGAEMIVTKHHDDPSLADVVNRIVSFANRITGMVDELLDLSRVQLGGGIPLARIELRPAALLESVIEELARRYPRNHFSLSGDARLKGTWDQERLRQVTARLITNAVRYGMKDGPIEIAMSQDEHCTEFAVHNELGEAPIPPEALPGLFEASRGHEREHGGTGLGLGLYIVREIVAAHGGRVAVDSTSTGTTFRVVLPNRE